MSIVLIVIFLAEVLPLSLIKLGFSIYDDKIKKLGYERVKSNHTLKEKIAEKITFLFSLDNVMYITPIFNLIFAIIFLRIVVDEKQLEEAINNDLKENQIQKIIEQKKEQDVMVNAKQYRAPINYNELTVSEKKEFLLDELVKLMEDENAEIKSKQKVKR